MKFKGYFINNKTAKTKVAWYIVPLDELEEEYPPVAGFSASAEEAEKESREYIDAYKHASVKITTLTGKVIKEP